LRGALQLDSRHAQARQALLSVLVEQKQWREALRVVTEGLALDPTQSGWAMVGARLLVEQGDLPRAAELLATHDAHGQRNADYQAFHGLLMHKLQRPKEAARYYQSAVSLRPAEGRWWYGLGLAYEADQRDAEAKDAYRRARDSGTLPPDLVPLIEQKLR
jgi:MSHA biogenesis protein MshN